MFFVEDIIKIEMPKDAEILTVQSQNTYPMIWAKVNPNNELEIRNFRIYGTGHKINEEEKLKYIGTFQMAGGNFIGHLFEILL